MQPAMNGHTPSELESALYSGWSRPLWACATGWIIFACITKQAGPIGRLLGARCFVPLSRLTYPAFLIHPIIMASFYGTRQASFQFSHYLMLYLILGNIVITYASAFILAALIELPFLSIERVVSRRLFKTN
uniref:Nose resistant to fluoxetine protein 6 n=2 Tax=Aceria tosichella TaxID=561515 RepID=A0A6G1SF07_9ACAR